MIQNKPSEQALENATIELMQKAFERSAESFGHFLGTKVQFDSVKKVKQDSMLSLFLLDEPISMIASEMKGDLRGTCYLIFSRKDAVEICHFQLGEKHQNNAELQDALLMELANILTASFVTVLANVLKIETHAHVPILTKIGKMEMFSTLESDQNQLDLDQKFRIQYTIEGIKIQPVFTWAFDSNINTYITKWVENEQNS